jgi:hypothetical protein
MLPPEPIEPPLPCDAPVLAEPPLLGDAPVLGEPPLPGDAPVVVPSTEPSFAFPVSHAAASIAVATSKPRRSPWQRVIIDRTSRRVFVRVRR